ncbi:hypothetical protein I862_04545 [endosymbiont of Acanthamoeba sp. UWC8]|nr:hypothetical protein I862_04545 [endosymbiont of Acanthamoeba sp. UWC8]
MQYAALLATAYILPRLKTTFFFSLPDEAPLFNQKEFDFLPLELKAYTGKINRKVISEPHYLKSDVSETSQRTFISDYKKLNFGNNNFSVIPIQEVYPKSFFNKLTPSFEFNRFFFSTPKHNTAYGNSNTGSGKSQNFKGSEEYFSDDEIKEAVNETETYHHSAAEEKEKPLNVINFSSEQIKQFVTTENKEDIKSTAFSLISPTTHNFPIADAYNFSLGLADDNHCRINLSDVNIQPQYNSFSSYIPALTYSDDNIAILKADSLPQKTSTLALTFVEDEKAVNGNTVKFLTSNNFPFSTEQNNYPLAIYHGSASIKFENNSSTEQAANIEKSKIDVTSEAANPEVEKDVPHFPRNQEENQNNTYHNHPPTVPPFLNGSICLKPYIKETNDKNSPNNLSNTISNQFNWSDFISSNLLYSALYAFGVAALYKLSLKSFFDEHSLVEDKSLKHKDIKHSNAESQGKEEDYKTKEPPKDDTHNKEEDDKDEGDDQSDGDDKDNPKDGDGGKIRVTSEEERRKAEEDLDTPSTISLDGDLEEDLEGVDTEFVTNEVRRDHFNEEERKIAEEEAIEAEKIAKEKARKLEEEATKAEIEATVKKQEEVRKAAKKAEQDKESQRKLDEELKQQATEERERARKEKQKAKQIKDKKRKIEDKINEITAEEDKLNSLYKNKNKIKESLKEAKQIITVKTNIIEDIKSSIEAKKSLKNKLLKEVKQKQEILKELNMLKEELSVHLVTYNELNNEIDSQLQLIQNSEEPDVAAFNLFKEIKEAKKAKILEDIINIINRNLVELNEVVDTYDLRRALEEGSDINSVIPIVNAIIENETRTERNLNSEITRYNEEIYALGLDANEAQKESNQATQKGIKLKDDLKTINEKIKLLRGELTEVSRTLDEEISSLEAQLKHLKQELTEVSRTLDEEIPSIENQLKLLRKELTEFSRTLNEEIEEASSILSNLTEERESSPSTTPLPIPSTTPLPIPSTTPLPIPSPTPLPSPTPAPEENIPAPYPNDEDSYLPESFAFTLPFAAPLVHVGLSFFEIVRAEGSSESI